MSAAFPDMTTVDEAAASHDLTVKETVFAELGITPTAEQETQMDTVIHQVSRAAASYCNRVFGREKVTSIYLPGCGRKQIYLDRRIPITTIHSVTVDGTVLDASEYQLHPTEGFLWRKSPSGAFITWWWATQVSIQYTGGYLLLGELPSDIERAAIDQCKVLFMSATRDPTIRSEAVPGLGQAAYSVAGGDMYGKSSGLLRSVEGLLGPYRFIVV